MSGALGAVEAGGCGGRVRVLVADDHPLYREGVARALSASGGVEIVGEASDGHSALEQIRECAPDVAVVDYRLPGLDGVAVASAVVRDRLATRVLLLSAFTDGEIVYRALETGAAGFLPKEARREEILDAVLACARGEAVLSRALSSELATAIRARAQDDRPILTERERQVLRLVAAGRSVSEIAGELHLAATTVKTHLRRVYEKLGVGDRAAAVAEAFRAGLLE